MSILFLVLVGASVGYANASVLGATAVISDAVVSEGDTIAFRLEAPVPSDMSRAEIGHIGIEFFVKLPSGSVIELWEDSGSAEVLPWDQVRRSGSRGKLVHWTIDELTGSRVTLDITKEMREGIGLAESIKLLIRALDENDDPIQINFLPGGQPGLHTLGR